MQHYHGTFQRVTDAMSSIRLDTDMTLSDALPLGILMTDREGTCLYSNAAYQKLCGWTGEELAGSHWSSVIHPEDHHKTIQHWDEAVMGLRPFLCEARLKCAGGEVIWTRRDAAPLPGHGYVHTVEDISLYKGRESTRMVYLAQHDALTGLPNRNAFYERFEHSLAQARRHGKPMGLLFIDLDNFRGTSEVLGHDSDDLILAALAGKLKACVRATDTVGRYGGDEFVVLLSEVTEPEHAFAVADKIREAAAEPMVINGQTVELQLRIGVSVYPDAGELKRTA